jgi:hypothetical protein
MNHSRSLLFLLGVTLAVTLLSASVLAQDPYKTVKVTIDKPVEVPGAVLPPGTYLFQELPNTQGNVVQIWNADHTKLITTAMTISNYRLQPADKPLVMFDQNGSNAPLAVKAYFYPGDNYGREFVYPKSKATELARRTNEKVLDMPDKSASDLETAGQSAQQVPAAIIHIVVTGVDPSGAEVAENQVVQSQPQN